MQAHERDVLRENMSEIIKRPKRHERVKKMTALAIKS